jgi:hypothetical protein
MSDDDHTVGRDVGADWLVVILIAGVRVALYLRKKRPEAYRRIGNGAGYHHDVRFETGELPVVTRQQ